MMNTEIVDRKPRVLTDIDLYIRYNYLIHVGEGMFARSGLLKGSSEDVSESDIDLIYHYLDTVAPDKIPPYTGNIEAWRLESRFKTQEETNAEIASRGIADPSYFANWSDPGGPGEHLRLATDASLVLMDVLQQGGVLREPVMAEPWAANTIEKINALNKYEVAAAAGFHDVGRLLTHLLSNERIGDALVRRLNIRPEIISKIPSQETFHKLPLDQDMRLHIQGLEPALLLVFISDNFGKRVVGTDRLLVSSDLTMEHAEKWRQGYNRKPLSGRPSDRYARSWIDLLVANNPRIIDGVDDWLSDISHIRLDDITREFNAQLGPTLQQIPVIDGFETASVLLH